MKTISSRQNAFYKRVRRAIDAHAEEIAIEGPKAVDDAIASGWKPLLIVQRASVIPAERSEWMDLHRLSGAGPSTSLEMTAELFDSLADTKTSQGVIALFERPHFNDIFSNRDRIVVALDGVQDPGNVGTIVRLAAAFDAAGVVLLPGCADAYGPKAIRASVGAILTVPVVSMSREELLARDWPLFVADGSGNAIDPPSRGAVIVFGNEGGGVSHEIAECATKIAIPMSKKVESLNVAASAAILLARSYALRSWGRTPSSARAAKQR